MGTGINYGFSNASSMNPQSSYDSPNCVNYTNSNATYLNARCHNLLTKVSNTTTITDKHTVTGAGWHVITSWLQQDTTLNGTLPTQIWMAVSQDGGQSFTKATELTQVTNDTDAEKRNLQSFMSNEHFYMSWEEEVNPGIFDVFVVESHDGGMSISPVENVSNNPTTESFDSELWGDILTGKWGLTWLEELSDGTVIEMDCGRC
jgi:hypothetical protein